MTILIWRLLCIISAALFVAVGVILLCLRLLKNVYYHSFEDDELIKEEQKSNSKNAIYFTSGETRKYIKKYVICKTLYDKFLVCNFTGNFRSISYYVVQYTKRRRVLDVLSVQEISTGDSSKVIALERNCARVNIVIGAVDGAVINTDVIRSLSVNKIRLSAFLKSIMLFTGLFVLRHVIAELIGGKEYVAVYMKNFMNYIAIAASFVFAFLGYFISVKCFRNKNVKGLSGGALEYDFL